MEDSINMDHGNGMAWNGFIWISLGTNTKCLWMWLWTFCSHKMKANVYSTHIWKSPYIKCMWRPAAHMAGWVTHQCCSASWLSRELWCLACCGRLEGDKASWSSPRKWRCRLALLRASHLSSDTQRAPCHYIVWLLSRNPFLVLGRNKEPVRFPVVPVCMSDVLTLTPTKVNCAGKCENVEYVFICLKSVCSCTYRYSTLQESLLLCCQVK